MYVLNLITNFYISYLYLKPLNHSTNYEGVNIGIQTPIVYVELVLVDIVGVLILLTPLWRIVMPGLIKPYKVNAPKL